MLSCLIMEKAFSFMLYNKKKTIRLWIQSFTVCPTCPQQYHRPVSPSQPQAQALILKASKNSLRVHSLHAKCFSSIQIQSSSRCKTPEESHLIETQIKQFWLFRQQDVNLGKEKGSSGAQPCTSCHYLQILICLSPTDFIEKELLPLANSNRNV